MKSKQIRGLNVINLADGTQVGTVDQVVLDLAAKQVVADGAIAASEAATAAG